MDNINSSVPSVAAEAGAPTLVVPLIDPVLDMLEQIRDQLDELGSLAQALLDQQRVTNDHLRRALVQFGL